MKISGVFVRTLRAASAVVLLIGIDGTFMQDLTSASPRMKAYSTHDAGSEEPGKTDKTVKITSLQLSHTFFLSKKFSALSD